jgi:hypothetical protein
MPTEGEATGRQRGRRQADRGGGDRPTEGGATGRQRGRRQADRGGAHVAHKREHVFQPDKQTCDCKHVRELRP